MLILRRNDDETWLEAALRHAEPHGLGGDVTEVYERLVADGHDLGDAAWGACYEWDVLVFEPEPDAEPLPRCPPPTATEPHRGDARNQPDRRRCWRVGERREG